MAYRAIFIFQRHLLFLDQIFLNLRNNGAVHCALQHVAQDIEQSQKLCRFSVDIINIILILYTHKK